MDYSIELVADFACHTGENPIWHPDQQLLYWLDIPQGRIFRYDPQTKSAETIYEGAVVGGMTIQEDGALLLFMEAGRISLLQNGALTTLIEGVDGEANKRFNDVIATPSGNVFCGTLSYLEGDTGSLYHLSRDRTLQKVIDGLGIANGMGYSPDLTQFYATDSVPARKIYRYQFDPETDALQDKTTFVQVPEENGLPDGLTVDAEGYIWSACWDGGKVIRYTPSGKIDFEIPIPGAKQVSSVTFGGPDYTDMYITTAGGQDKHANGENAGALFCVRSDSFKGRPEYRSRIETD